jgi:alanine-glyoxylate transaminase/serine-glyoxylate transaminase/serine-pyruvate transaminase
VPDGVDEAKVRGQLLSEYGIEIAGGMGDLKGRIWRIGLMGYSSREENVVLLLAALRRILQVTVGGRPSNTQVVVKHGAATS